MDKKKETKSRKIQVRYTPSDYAALEKKAEKEGRTVSGLLRYLSMNYVNK